MATLFLCFGVSKSIKNRQGPSGMLLDLFEAYSEISKHGSNKVNRSSGRTCQCPSEFKALVELNNSKIFVYSEQVN